MASEGKSDVIRKPAVAGTFYPEENRKLEKLVNSLLRVEVPHFDHVVGLIAPHAGYMFSGAIAARAYAVASGLHPEVVAIIAPSHRERFDGVCIYDGDAYATPLGKVMIDTELRDRLLQFGDPVFAGIAGHRAQTDGEHAIEVQLPFLQRVFPGVKILPLVMGRQGWPVCEFLGLALGEVLQEKPSLVVASSDLSHYHSYEEARKIDQCFIENLQKADPMRLAKELRTQHCEACGGGPIVATLYATQLLGAHNVEIIAYLNSGDVWHDRTSVVGYLAAAFC